MSLSLLCQKLLALGLLGLLDLVQLLARLRLMYHAVDVRARPEDDGGA